MLKSRSSKTLKNDSTIFASSFTLMKVPVDMEGVSFRVGDRLRAERERESGRTGITEVNPIMGGM